MNLQSTKQNEAGQIPNIDYLISITWNYTNPFRWKLDNRKTLRTRIVGIEKME